MYDYLQHFCVALHNQHVIWQSDGYVYLFSSEGFKFV